MNRRMIGIAGVLCTLLAVRGAQSFCGFYVAKADTKLFNKASQVVMVRHDDKTVLTMSNDFKGDPKEFAIVIPVPTILEKDQIHVTDKKYLDHLDAYSAPRLVEYHDENPCMPIMEEVVRMAAQAPSGGAEVRDKSLGVKIEATYTVGEYDILILSAKESGGLETWLRQEGYKIPKGASRVLESYIKQKLKFFVAKVNLKEQSKLGFTYLRPIQVAYESPKFMLPIRLGMVNADGPQELFVFALTRAGRVETTNYRTVKLPTDVELPPYIKDDFANFYRDMFTQQVKKEEMRAVFLEYAWDMNWCDPCAADPLSREELQELGVFWLDDGPQSSDGRIMPPQPGGAQQTFISRLHLRYDNEHFPEDLVFQETGDRANFQSRYIMRHPWKGSDDCPEAVRYREELRARQMKEAQTLADLTGWKLEAVHQKMNLDATAQPASSKWYQKLWKKDK